MQTVNEIRAKIFFKELRNKLVRYKRHFIIAVPFIFAAGIISCFFHQNGQQFINEVSFGNPLNSIFVLLLGVLLLGVVNLPDERKYQEFLPGGKRAVGAVNIAIAAIIGLYTAVIMALSPYFTAAIGIAAAQGNGAVYPTLIFKPVEPLYDFLICALIVFMAFSAVYKLMLCVRRGVGSTVYFAVTLTAAAIISFFIADYAFHGFALDSEYAASIMTAIIILYSAALNELMYFIPKVCKRVLFKRGGAI